MFFILGGSIKKKDYKDLGFEGGTNVLYLTSPLPPNIFCRKITSYLLQTTVNCFWIFGIVAEYKCRGLDYPNV